MEYMGTLLERNLIKNIVFFKINIWMDKHGQITNFLDNDFEEFNLEFKEKIDPK